MAENSMTEAEARWKWRAIRKLDNENVKSMKDRLDKLADEDKLLPHREMVVYNNHLVA